jgi:hypothetical protein
MYLGDLAGSKDRFRGCTKIRKSLGSHRVLLLKEIHVMNNLKAPDSRNCQQETQNRHTYLYLYREVGSGFVLSTRDKNNLHYDNFRNMKTSNKNKNNLRVL